MCKKSVSYKLGIMMYRCLHGQAPRYLADHLITASDVASRLRLRCAKTANRHQLIVPRCRLNTYGRRAFSIAGPTVWNSRFTYLGKGGAKSHNTKAQGANKICLFFVFTCKNYLNHRYAFSQQAAATVLPLSGLIPLIRRYGVIGCKLQVPA